jgi:ATP-dependent protease ClpP protease subunit
MLNYVDTTGNIYILGDFDSTISQNVVPGLVKRIQEETDKPNGQIWFYINSRGGYCHELYNLLSLIDVAKSIGIKIYTVVMGNAYSCGSILAIHGDHRAIYKYGKHLAHLGQQGDTVTTFKQIERSNKRWLNTLKTLFKCTKIIQKCLKK